MPLKHRTPSVPRPPRRAAPSLLGVIEQVRATYVMAQNLNAQIQQDRAQNLRTLQLYRSTSGRTGPDAAERDADALRLAAFRRACVALDFRRASASLVSHRLMTPLAAIKASAELMQQKGFTAAERAQLLSTIRSNAERLESLAERLIEEAEAAGRDAG